MGIWYRLNSILRALGVSQRPQPWGAVWTRHPCFTAQRASKPCPGCQRAVSHCGWICAALSSGKQTSVCVHYVSFIFNVRFWKISRSYIWKTTNHSISKSRSLGSDTDVPPWDIRTSGEDIGITLCLPASLPNRSGLSPTTELLGWDCGCTRRALTRWSCMVYILFHLAFLPAVAILRRSHSIGIIKNSFPIDYWYIPLWIYYDVFIYSCW